MATAATYGAQDRKKIERLVKDNLLLPSKEVYGKVHVSVKHERTGKQQTLDVFMLRAYTYTADIARMVIDADYKVWSLDPSYTGGEEEHYPADAVAESAAAVPAPRDPDMVFGTPFPEIPTAKAGVESACKIARAAGYRVVKLLGKKANLANYKRYLSGHLKAFGNIGHGYTGGIVLADGNLTSAWFSGLPAKQGLSPEVIYFNSCQTFNPPLQPAIMHAGARTFVGGKVNLLVGDSEEVFKCFWTKVLGRPHEKTGAALTTCEKQKYPTANAHGISGDLDRF
jgi:hypothetical protein